MHKTSTATSPRLNASGQRRGFGAALGTATLLLLAGCGGGVPVHRGESFEPDPRHQREFAESAPRLCEAARSVLLGQGYVLRGIDANPLVLDASKQFAGEKQSHTVLRVVVNCLQHRQGGRLFVTAEEESFDVKRSSESSAIGLPIVGPVTVARSTSGEHQVKTSGQTVADERFYDRFFSAIRAELGRR